LRLTTGADGAAPEDVVVCVCMLECEPVVTCVVKELAEDGSDDCTVKAWFVVAVLLRVPGTTSCADPECWVAMPLCVTLGGVVGGVVEMADIAAPLNSTAQAT